MPLSQPASRFTTRVNHHGAVSRANGDECSNMAALRPTSGLGLSGPPQDWAILVKSNGGY